MHSAFGLFSKKTGADEEVICSLDVSKENGYSIYFEKVIIIDEITMISANVLESINTGLKRLASPMNDYFFENLFGGKHILLFGDLAQVQKMITMNPFFNLTKAFCFRILIDGL